MDNSLANYQYLYLHGLASSPLSSKAVYFGQQYQQLGIDLNVIDFNQPDFASLTLTRQIDRVKQELEQKSTQQFILIGSSFGGLTANWIAHYLPQKVKALILLAPALNFWEAWSSKIPEQGLLQWQQTGILPVYHYGEQKQVSLNYTFWQDLQRYNDSAISHNVPTLVFHGIHDDTVPIIASRLYARQNPHATLIELDSNHGLNDRQEQIYRQMNDWLSLIINCNN